jgi:hypothetical protein
MAQLCCGSLNFSSIDGRSASSVVQCVCRLSAPSCPFHEERETGGQAAQGFFAERLSETQQQLSLASAASWSRSARMRAACIRGCRARPPCGGSPPLFCPLMHLFVCFPGPPIAHPLSSGGGFASTLLLTRSRIDTGSRCARTPSPYECSSK